MVSHCAFLLLTYLLQTLFANLKNQLLKKKSTKHSAKAAAGELKGILGVSDVPLVSCDFGSDPRSSIVDADLTMVMDGNMVKVVSWYDNEWGYSERLIDMAAFVASKGL